MAFSGAKDNVGVAGYLVYRDGKKIAETDKPQYTDYGKCLGKIHRNMFYTVIP